MPVPTVITDLSTTAASNYPAGTDSPSTLDDVQRAHASFIAGLRDGKGFSNAVTLASAGTTDIGSQSSQFVEISGTTTITSLGTNYNGPRYLRFTGILTLTYNATSLILPGAASITTAAGDTAIAVPNQGLTGWTLYLYQRSGGSVTSVAVSGGTTGLTTSGGPVTSAGTITLAGTLAVANGGTGSTTLAANNVLLGNGTSALQAVAPSTAGNVLTSNGTTWQSTAPAATGVTSFLGLTGAVNTSTVNTVGSVMVLLYATIDTGVTNGTDYAGSGLRYGATTGLPFGETGTLTGTACSGTWRCMGGGTNSGGSSYSRALFIRIS